MEKYLRVCLKFDDLLAAFLAENLQYLNGFSVELLTCQDSSTLMALRCSTICQVNDPGEMRYFKLLLSGLKYTEPARVRVLEDAIRKTQAVSHPISLKKLKACIDVVQTADLS